MLRCYFLRAVAQLGRALEWGSRGPGFKSRQPDFFILAPPVYTPAQYLMKIGMIKMATMLTTLIIGLMAGPAVSL